MAGKPELRSTDRKVKKRCQECSYFGTLNDKQMCESCAINNESEKCGKCSVQVREGDHGVQCEFCKLWYHAGCGNVSIKIYRILKEEQNLPWSCMNCKAKVVRNTAEVARLREEISNLKDEIKELNIHNNWIRHQTIDNEDKWEDRGRIVAEQAADKVMEKIWEKEEKERRKNNLIIFNVPESDKEDGKDRAKEDTETCEHIFVHKLEVENFKIEKVVRLRKKTIGKSRPTLVKVEDEGMKWHIISQGKKLKNDYDEKIRKIGLSPDLTKAEQQENQRLRNILEEKKKQGGMWKIQRGRIINLDVPYWQQTNYGQKPQYQYQYRRQSTNETGSGTERPKPTQTRQAIRQTEEPGNLQEQQREPRMETQLQEQELNENGNWNTTRDEEEREDQGN
ncbi:hypothetical protein Pmani_023245 [Petrolisthes manimaculis]|uniref:PHD-type domain-containing protein n=1 Tax=Petrolisthes manimaculis TaxID=1843537 RepID=A0AAE1PCL8_9EUCA|nr:hypothetical protein Pmani_023245 [Petrolisthes manimaculis]